MALVPAGKYLQPTESAGNDVGYDAVRPGALWSVRMETVETEDVAFEHVDASTCKLALEIKSSSNRESGPGIPKMADMSARKTAIQAAIATGYYWSAALNPIYIHSINDNRFHHHMRFLQLHAFPLIKAISLKIKAIINARSHQFRQLRRHPGIQSTL